MPSPNVTNITSTKSATFSTIVRSRVDPHTKHWQRSSSGNIDFQSPSSGGIYADYSPKEGIQTGVILGCGLIITLLYVTYKAKCRPRDYPPIPSSNLSSCKNPLLPPTKPPKQRKAPPLCATTRTSGTSALVGPPGFGERLTSGQKRAQARTWLSTTTVVANHCDECALIAMLRQSPCQPRMSHANISVCVLPLGNQDNGVIPVIQTTLVDNVPELSEMQAIRTNKTLALTVR